MKTLKYSLIWAFMFVILSFGVNGALSDGLVDYWTFDNNSLQSSIGKIASSNSGTTNLSGILGQSRKFTSASSNYINLTNTNTSFDVTSFSISYWVYLDTANSGNIPTFWKGFDISTRWYFWLYSGNVTTFETIGTTPSSLNKYSASSNFNTSTWYHMVVTINDTTKNKSYYQNGKLLNSTTYTGSPITGTDKIILGKFTTNYLNGRIDEFGFWNRSLNSAEITQLYNNGTGFQYPFISALTFSNISLVNNTYFNTSSIQINTSVLNTSTNGNENQTAYLYYNNGTFINSTQYATNNLNGTLNLNSLTDNTYKIYFYAKNNQTNVTSSNYTFTIDTTVPVINNNILSEYNYYTNNNLNSSCTDTNLLSCNISINGQNKPLNATSFNFTTNGNQTYNITAIDLAGNTVTESGVTLVNPYQYFRAYDTTNSSYITNFTVNSRESSNGYVNFTTYELGLGNTNFTFAKLGFPTTTATLNINTTSNINYTYNLTPAKIIISVFDRTSGNIISGSSTRIDLVSSTGYNSSTTTGYLNITNINFVNEDYIVIAQNSLYYTEPVYFTFNNQENLNLNIYMVPLNLTNYGFVTVRTLTDISQLVSGAICQALEWKPALSSYVSVAQGETNVNGEVNLNIELGTKLYKFHCSRNGDEVSSTAQIISTSGTVVPLIIEETFTETQNAFGTFKYSLTNTTFSGTQQIINLTFSDTNNLVTTGCLYAYEVHGTKRTIIGNPACASTTTGHTFLLLNVNQTYNIIVVATATTSKGIQEIDSISFKGNGALTFLLGEYGLDIIIPVVFVIIGVSVGFMLIPQNIFVSAVASIIMSWLSVLIVPTIISTSIATFITFVSVLIIWGGFKPK
jgi:hypothetical protein